MRKKRALLFSLRKVAGYAAIMLFSVLSTYLLMNYAGNKEEELVRYQEFSTPAVSVPKSCLPTVLKSG